MLVKDVIKFFGSASNVAKVLNISRQAVNQWSKRDLIHVPELQALKLEKLTKKKLKYKISDYK